MTYGTLELTLPHIMKICFILYKTESFIEEEYSAICNFFEESKEYFYSEDKIRILRLYNDFKEKHKGRFH